LDPPQEAQALLGSVKDDYAALQAQVENAYQERLRAVHQRFNRGDMTPNETAAALQAASHERTARLERVEQQMGHLLQGAVLECAHGGPRRDGERLVSSPRSPSPEERQEPERITT
jgi:hypothetical protein